MKQMDRQLLILHRLRAERPLRAVDLAEECECSVRTIYRDIEALSAAGVPVAALPGEGYRLVPGFHLPPIAFTAEEAAQLMRGAESMRGLGTKEHEDARRAALAKLEAALPDSTLAEVARLQERVRAESWSRRPASEWLDALLQATLEDRVVRLRYHSFGGDEVTEREVEPHHLSYYADDWHVRGYCRLREGGRDFRLGRVQHAEVTDEHFERRAELAPSVEPIEVRPAIEVRVWVSESALPWAREELPFGFQREELVEGGAVFVIESRDQRRLLPWVLRWGASVRVVAPDEVVRALAAEARALARAYAGA
jgi:predicted DNA-binding transcriptional regulator YafY